MGDKPTYEELERRVQELEQSEIERQSAASALRESEERLDFVLKGSQLGFWDWNLETNEVKRNERWAEMLGYSLQDIEFTVNQWLDFIHPDDRSLALQSIQDHLEGRTPMHKAEYRMLTKDGQHRWILDQAQVVKWDSHGRPIRMSGTHTDITEHKLAAEALRLSEVWHRTLVETIPDLVWLKDLDGVYLSCNPTFERYFGAKESDIVGKTDYDFKDKDLADFFREHDRKAIDAGRPSVNEEWLTFPDNGYHGLFETIKTPMRDSEGHFIGVLGIARDITERKRAEKALAESEAHFRAYFELGLIGMAITSPEKGWVQFNDRLCDIFGYSRKELSRMTWAEITHPDDLAADEAQFERVARGEIDSYRMEKRFIHKDGGTIYTELSVKCVRRNDGRVDHFVAMVQDIDERKRAEEALRESESFIKAVMDNLPIGVAVNSVHPSVKFVYWGMQLTPGIIAPSDLGHRR